MPITYKLIQKSQPGVAGDGTKKWYASLVNTGEMDIDTLVSEIEKFSALSEADIKGVIIALENVIQNALADSKIIRLEKLGNLYPSLSSQGVADEKDFVARTHIKNVKVNYRPGQRILNALRNADLKKQG